MQYNYPAIPHRCRQHHFRGITKMVKHQIPCNFFRSLLEKNALPCYCMEEIENSTDSGRCFRQGNNLRNQFQDLHFGLEEGCTRKDQRTTVSVFSTSSSPFSYPRENGSEKQLQRLY